MQRRRTVSVATLILGLAASFATAQQPLADIASEIMQLERDQAAATVRGDRAALERFLADDYTETTPTGPVMSKAEALDVYKPGEFESSEPQGMKVRAYGDVAVVNGVYVIRPKGKKVDERYAFTNVWVKSAGRWRLVASQTSEIKSSLPAK